VELGDIMGVGDPTHSRIAVSCKLPSLVTALKANDIGEGSPAVRTCMLPSVGLDLGLAAARF
jgi:hypothetical protein